MNILVVEDEPSLRNTITMALTSCGHPTTSAETGNEALERAREERPGLVLLDLQLPEMDGWEFLRHFRALQDCATVPVVVTSAAHNVVTAELDAQAFLPKPFDLDELLDVVEELLSAPHSINSRDGPRSVGAIT
jgi:DNA-binding response OmpR family regulator